MRLEVESKSSAGFIPDRVVIRGYHPEFVVARRYVAVIRLSTVAGFDPVLVVTLEHVLESDLFRRKKAQTRIPKDQITSSRRRFGSGADIESGLIDCHSFEMNGRRKRV